MITEQVQVPTQEDARHVQNSKLLTKLLFLADSGTRGMGTVENPLGTFQGVVSYEGYQDSALAVLRYTADSELNGSDQWKVWVKSEKRLVFHAADTTNCYGEQKRELLGPTFLWRMERPHGRPQPSNTFIGGWTTKMPPLQEPVYELLAYARGEQWENDVTRIAKSMLEPDERKFDVPYHSTRILELPARFREKFPYKNILRAAGW